MKRLVFALLCSALISTAVFAQSLTSSNLSNLNSSNSTAKNKNSDSLKAQQANSLTQMGNVQLAMSVPNYLVTAGDIYTLAFVMGTNAVSYNLAVDSTYRIRVANLGVIDASGKTFVELKRQVENLVSKNYPMSGVQFVLSSAATFKVTIKGEVVSTTEKNAWALTRLSELFKEEDLLTRYSSKRNVVITSANGKTKTYDLFKADRFGDMDQDPYLRPNDVITINRFQRTATIKGTVERPGTYELLEGENLKDLVEVYGGGLAPLADTTRIEVTHMSTEAEKTGETTYVSQKDVEENYKIEPYDTIYIPTYKDLRPSIFIEGAVITSSEITSSEIKSSEITSSEITSSEITSSEITSSEITSDDLRNTNRLTVTFSAGEKYTSFVRSHSKWFSSSVADTANSYIVRGSEQIPLDVYKIVYDQNFESDETLQSNDTLVIPFKQYFVSVSGAVKVPGRYPYIPDRGWEYYISLAGGFVKTENSRQKIVIKNIDGKNMSKSDPITPETTIEAVTNSGLYYFNLYAPIITTLIGTISTALSILAVTGVLK